MRVRTALLSVLIVLAGVMPASAASPDEVEFDGSGWGHGVGLSQWGAYGLAERGATYQAILAHYFQGTSVDTMAAEPTIWVNLERDFSTLTLKVLDIGSTTGADVGISSPAGNLTAKSGTSISMTALGTTGCSIQVSNNGGSFTSPDCTVDMSWYPWAISGQTPTTKVQIEGCTLTDWNATPTTSRPCQYARGVLHLRSGDGGLDLSAEMLMDDYVMGISEIPFRWPEHALKAQAVAARSYAEAKRIQRGNPATNSCAAWCHVKDSTADQRYVGWGHTDTGPWNQAVKATANQVITHSDSSTGAIGVITAYYSSSSGGRTEYGHERGFASSPVQWLTSVDDSVAVNGTVPNPNAAWTAKVPTSTLATALGWDYLTSALVTKRRPGSGSAAEVTFGGIKGGVVQSVVKTGSWVRSTLGLKSEYFDVLFKLAGDEMFFYRDDGRFAFYYTHSSGVLGSPILSGSGYTSGWDSITSVDLDGDGQDEMFFYREDGLFRFYNVRADGSIGSPILAGDGYTTGWDSITAVDLDGDGQDEMFFYREDGLFRFYNVRPDGTLPRPMLAGSGYTRGWDAITAVDLDADSQDEVFFYRDDGLFRFYQVRPDGSLPKPVLEGSGYTKGWDAITAVDLGGDGDEEMFFYRDDGLFRYYSVDNAGHLSRPILAGSNYSSGWDAITSINLDGR